MLNFEDFFYKGDILSSYYAAKNDNTATSEKYVQLFEKHQVHKIPLYLNQSAIQSIENEKEAYEEDAWVMKIRSIKDAEPFHAEVKAVENCIQDGTSEDRALAYYTQGRLFLFSHLYEEAIYSFIQAVKVHPTKSLYAGTVGQTMLRLNYSPIEALGYLELAQSNDSQNARWNYCRSLLLLQLYKDLQLEHFLDSAIYEMQMAKENCRPEQKSLNSAIEQLDREIAEIFRNL